jgi:apolipoprotein N-acyltransferase
MIFLGAGLLLGGAFLDARLQLLSWLGIAVLAFALHRTRSRRKSCAGLFLAILTKQSVALHWLIGTQTRYLGVATALALALSLLTFFASAILLSAPSIVVLPFMRRIPVRWWLPVCWAAGETWLEELSGASMGHMLHSQWDLQPILRCLAYTGWHPTLLLIVYMGCCMGQAAASRSIKGLFSPALVVAFLLFLPKIPTLDDALEGVGVVHLASVTRLPESVPTGVELLVWPEQSVRGRHRLSEGRLSAPAPLEGFTRISATPHLVGVTLSTPAGMLNAAAILDSAGQVLSTRGKSVLVPFGERALWGIPILTGKSGFTPGHAPPLFLEGPRRTVPVICYEVFSRNVVMQGSKAGGALIAVLSSDRALAHNRIALEQSIGALILRAVEFHLPAVRASVRGRAAIVSSDGHLLEQSFGQASGILLVSPNTLSSHATQELAET